MATKASQIPFDQEASEVWALAERIGLLRDNVRQDPINRSFKTLLLAILEAPGDTCGFFRSYVREHHVSTDKIVQEAGVAGSWEELNIKLRNAPLSSVMSSVGTSTSVAAVLDQASDLARELGAPELGVRHLIASAILRSPGEHREELNRWGFLLPEPFTRNFYQFVIGRFKDEEQVWTKLLRTQRTANPSSKAESQRSESYFRPQSTGYAFTPPANQVILYAERIASAHRTQVNRPDPVISCSTLWFALIEFGRSSQDNAAVTLAEFIDARTDVALKIREQMEQYTGPSSAQASSAAGFSNNMKAILSAAAQFSSRTRGKQEIGLRPLIAALILRGPLLQGSVFGDRLRQSGFDEGQFRRYFYRAIETNPADDKFSQWREILALNSTAQLPAFSADTEQGIDMLDIGRDVEAFANLICDKRLAPPLSIGLFGDWGSGKSFFMRLLREKVDAISKAARDSDSAVFSHHVVQRVFNAWHYVDQSLWATLVSEIFDGLFKSIEAPQDREQLRAQVQEKLKSANGVYELAKAEVSRAVDEVNKARTKLTEAQEQRQQKSLTPNLSDLERELVADALLQQNLETIKEAAGLDQLSGTYSEIMTVVRDARTFLGRMHALWRTGKQSPRQIVAALLLMGSLAFLVFTLTWISRQAWLSQVKLYILAWTPAVTAVIAWGGEQLRRLTNLTDQIESAAQKMENRRQERIAQATSVQTAELVKAQQAESVAKENLAKAEQKKYEIEQDLDNSLPGKQLQRFILERTDSTDYRKHLGLVSLIRHDFETLSELLLSDNKLPVDRIVLYIDDLDRCPPQRVVEVLEAIHLLLAFKLFVIIIGVDARWVTKSLETIYPRLNPEDATSTYGVATAHDYLEKIFQIPFWIRPMNAEGSRNLISGLFQDQVGKSLTAQEQIKAAAVQAGAGVSGQAAISQAPIPISNGEVAIPGSNVATGSSPLLQQNPAPAKDALPEPPREVLDPGRLEISEYELEYMRELSSFVGTSPRRVKRFANIYRLVRAAIPGGYSSDTFVGLPTKPGDYQAVLTLLAILTGAPNLAGEMLRKLGQLDPKIGLSGLIKDSWKSFSGRDREQARCVDGALKLYQTRNTAGEDLSALRRWQHQLSRFSFRQCI